MTSRPQPELRVLTSARGIAAWLVVLYHIRLSIAGLPQVAVDWLGKGYLAVDFFFLLSGFVIWMTWHPRLRGDGLAAVPAFLRKRVARIWPLHAVVLSGGVALALALAATGRHDPREFPFGELPLHVLLLQNWGFTAALAWNDPAWSISAELGAYLLFPLFSLAIDWRRVPSVLIVAAIAALVTLMAGVYAAAGAATLGDAIPRLGLIRCGLEFAVGTAIAALWLRWRDAPHAPSAIAIVAAGVAAVATIAGRLPETIGAPAAFAALLLALALSSGGAARALEARAMHWLGEVSYATYLGHFLLWKAFKLAFVSDAAAVPPHLVMLYLAAVLASSAILHRWVERPAQQAINAWRPRRPLAA